jgi:hypothetical protein
MADNDAQGSITNFSMAATPATNAPSNIPGGPGIPAMTTEQRENPTPQSRPWSITQAAQIAMGDFKKAEAYRTINHDWRFRVSDQLYLAWTQRKTWEGTKIPRSSVGIFLSLEQIEALLPTVVLALFPDNNRLPFDVEPLPTTTMGQAQAVRDLLSSQLGDLGEEGKYLTLREICRRAYKSSYIYGNGIVEFGVLDKYIQRTKFDRMTVPIRQMVPHPITGEPVPVPTGQTTTHVRKTLTEEHIVRPMMNNVDVRDFYWDPNCSSHNIQDAGYCAVRTLMSVRDLAELAQVDGFHIPPQSEMKKLADIKTTSQGDTSKMNQESFRGMTWQPAIDYTVDPALQRVEVIRYWQKNRHVWILGRQWVAYNDTNPYGLLPFLDAFYVDVPGRFAGLSICDLVEGDQKLAEAIINARIDELNLLIHPPIIKKQGRSFTASQQRLRPGVIWEAEDPKNDYIRFEMGNITNNAYVEVQALEQRVQKKTGVTDLAVLGTPTSGGNSANRTATGVSSQEGASGKRIQYHVENAEDQFLVPALNILHILNQIFLPADQMMQILGPEMQQITIDPVDILNASVKFKINASSKMRSRNALASGGLGLVLQTYMNPEFIQLQMMNGQKPDMDQFTRIINDTFGLPPRALWAPMSQQEQQEFIQMKMMPEMLKRQVQKDRLDAHQAVTDSKDETALIKTVLEKILTPQAAHLMLNEYMGTDLDTNTGNEPPPPGQVGTSGTSGAA